MLDQDIAFLVFSTSITFLLISIGLILFIIFFSRSKRAMLLDKQKAELRFVKEINKIKIEIQSNTLNKISKELHDNVGQLLTLAKIHTNHLVQHQPSKQVTEIDSVLLQAIEEIRSISRSLNTDHLREFGLLSSVKGELQRLQRIDGLSINYDVTGTSFGFARETEIVIYRIIQEFITNSLKHSNASEINVTLEYKDPSLAVLMSDNGKGFDPGDIVKGSGLENMRNRAKLINADLNISSQTDQGTKLTLTITQDR